MKKLLFTLLLTMPFVAIPSHANADSLCCCVMCYKRCYYTSCGTCPATCGAGEVSVMPGVSDLWAMREDYLSPLLPKKECAEEKVSEKRLSLDWNKRVEGIEKTIWEK